MSLTQDQLKAFASNATKEIDVGGDVIDIGDDLGIGLMTNQNQGYKPTSSSSPRVSFMSGSGSGSGSNSGSGVEMPTLNIKPVDDLGVVDLDAAPGVSDIQLNRSQSQSQSQSHDIPFVIGGGGGGGGGGGSSQSQSQSQSYPDMYAGGVTMAQELKEKNKYLTKIKRLEISGYTGNPVSINNSLSEIKDEYDRRADIKNFQGNLQFYRRVTSIGVLGIETLSTNVGGKLPAVIRPRLTGWTEAVQSEIENEEYDGIFEDLHDLYKDSANMHPVMRLVAALGMSAVQYHITSSMIQHTDIPGLTMDVLHENPELKRLLAQAALSRMAAGANPAGGSGSGSGAGTGAGPAAMGSVPPPAFAAPMNGATTRGIPFNVASSAEAPKRREMQGPTTNLTDVARAFEAERNATMGPSLSSVHSTVFTPSGPPPIPAQNGRDGLGGQFDPLREFGGGGGGSDSRSDGSGGTTGTSGGRRGRRPAEPVGATMTLNV